MKLILTLKDEYDSHTAELELTKADLKSDQVQVFEEIKLNWAAVREAYLHG
jgi:hypothetical protein